MEWNWSPGMTSYASPDRSAVDEGRGFPPEDKIGVPGLQPTKASSD
jgi:hypothetical protein